MEYKKINENIFYDIANAIRGQLGESDYYHPSEMASKILQIHGEPTLSQITVSANGLYSAPTGYDGFNPVVVAVPNTFSEADAGKVVSGASLVAQTPISFTSNGTYDTTQNNEVTVNVEGGGGTDTSDATLQSGSQMLSGYTAYARGSKYTGTIPMYNGSINSGQGSVPSYDYYSGSYTLTPSTVAQAFPTAGKIMSADLQLLSYSAGAEPYSGSYVITPSIFSQAFPTAGKLLSQDIQVEPYSIDFYSGSYTIIPSAEAFSVLTSGKTLLSDLTIQAYNPSERAYQGDYTATPTALTQVFSTSGKVMLSDFTVLPASAVYMDGDAITLSIGGSAYEFHASEYAPSINTNAFLSANNLLSASFDYCQNIGYTAFMDCVNLSQINLPRCYTMSNRAFANCSALTSIDMPALGRITYSAFKDCGLLSLASFASVVMVENNAFNGCSNLSDVYFNQTFAIGLSSTDAFDSTPFSYNDSAYARIHVPAFAISDYKTDSVWSNFSNCFVAIEEGE